MIEAAGGARVLIVEDEPTLAENLYNYLERQGMVPDAAYDGHAALALLRASAFDLVVLDLGLPGLSGLEVLRAMQQDPALWRPVLVLTARDRLEDKLLAFDLGAEDYLVKPFSLAEVAARLLVLMRRGRNGDAGPVAYGNVEYDPRTHLVTLDGRPQALPRKSVLLLAVLLHAAGEVVPHDRLIDVLWPEGPPSGRALHDQVHLLRRRLRAAHGPDIVADPGRGWRLVTAPSGMADTQASA